MGDNDRVTDLAAFVKRRYEESKKNRKSIIEKMAKNREAFLGLADNHFKKSNTEDWRSNDVTNHTRQKVTWAIAILVDMVLQGGRFPFMIIPESDASITEQQLPEDWQQQLDKDRDDLKKLIDRWLDESEADKNFALNAFAGALHGETFAKKVIIEVERPGYRPSLPENVSDLSRIDLDNIPYERYVDIYEQPGWEFVSGWTVLYDSEAPDMVSGDFQGQYALVSPYWLNKFKGEAFWNDDAIDKVISKAHREAAGQETKLQDEELPPYMRDIENRKKSILHIEYWGLAPKELVEKYLRARAMKEGKDPQLEGSAKEPLATDSNRQEHSAEMVECMVTCSDGEITRYAPTERRDRPIIQGYWQRRLEEQGGMSVADNCESMQKVLDTALRGLIDNKHMAGSTILATKDEYFLNRLDRIFPGMRLRLSEDCEDARQALQQVRIADVGEAWVSLINLASSFLEEDSMIPRASQGLPGKKDETAFAAGIRAEQSGKYMGQVVKNYDEMIEGMLEHYVDVAIMDPDIQEGRGSYTVKALGFSSFQARLQRIEKLTRFMELIMQHPQLRERYKIDDMVTEIGKMLDLDPAQFEYSETERMANERKGNPVEEATLEKLQAEIEKTQAETEKAQAQAENERAATQATVMESRQKALETTGKLLQSLEPPAPAVPPGTVIQTEEVAA